VETVADARAAVEACKFAPAGKRSVSGSYPMFDFASVPLKDSLRVLNDNTLLVCMIETVKGLDNLEAIAAIDGIDVLHLGCNDLLVNMGKPGAFGDPDMIAAVERVLTVSKTHGKFAGLGGDRDIERQARFIHAGLRFVTTQTDIAFLMAEASKRTQTLRNAVAAAKA
jgi:2-keto-3-deoxy-L-rhamnonate aldolase RhmA